MSYFKVYIFIEKSSRKCLDAIMYFTTLPSYTDSLRKESKCNFAVEEVNIFSGLQIVKLLC